MAHLRIAALAALLLSVPCAGAQTASEIAGPDADAVVTPTASTAHPGADWQAAGAASARLLVVMHAFRWATEPGTRQGGFALGEPYLRSAASLHGWADGDPFYVNFVGHPMEGAVAGRIFSLNDPAYRRAEFGQSAAYWKGKLRAAAFAWAFSTQFEIGPLSEASIGHIQRDFPQQGFADHVVTPAMGLAWTVAEDALDRYGIQWLEDRTGNRWVRLAVRSGLNPTRTFANVLAGKAPWHRDTRPGILQYQAAAAPRPKALSLHSSRAGIPAPFEFSAEGSVRRIGDRPCVGGGAEVAWRVAPDWQAVLDVNGCKMLELEKNSSGDALIFQLGTRWTPAPTGKWSPYTHLFIGGVKLTREQLLPDKKTQVLAANRNLDPALAYTLHGQYTRQQDATGLAVSAGTGVDYRVNPALAIRVARLDYLRTRLPGSGVQLTTGIVLRIGTW
jgi:hypothetical protein